MKVLDKIALILFSIIVLVISVVMVLLIFSVISFDSIEMLYTQMMANNIANNVVLGISLISIVLAVKAIFFGGDTSNEYRIVSGAAKKYAGGLVGFADGEMATIQNSFVQNKIGRAHV